MSTQHEEDDQTILIREATEQDIDSITEFQCCMARETENRELNAQIVHRGVSCVFEHSPHRGFYLVAQDTTTNKVVGSLLVTYEWSDWNCKQYWYFQSVFIMAEYRRRGIFTRLHKRVEQMAIEKDAAALRLYVDQDNKNAQATYLKLGMDKSHYLMFEKNF
jgi:GNAT superfamily N-acetyltransferase